MLRDASFGSGVDQDFCIHAEVFSSPSVLKYKVERVPYTYMTIKAHSKCILDLTRTILLVLAWPCEVCVIYWALHRHIQSHTKE